MCYADYKPKRPAIVERDAKSQIEVFMAGDVAHAKQVIRRFCLERPCCVTVSPTTYVYRGGEEDGFVVTFRNYPRFPSEPHALAAKAFALADLLRSELAQDSYMVVDGECIYWDTQRKDS